MQLSAHLHPSQLHCAMTARHPTWLLKAVCFWSCMHLRYCQQSTSAGVYGGSQVTHLRSQQIFRTWTFTGLISTSVHVNLQLMQVLHCLKILVSLLSCHVQFCRVLRNDRLSCSSVYIQSQPVFQSAAGQLWVWHTWTVCVSQWPPGDPCQQQPPQLRAGSRGLRCLCASHMH